MAVAKEVRVAANSTRCACGGGLGKEHAAWCLAPFLWVAKNHHLFDSNDARLAARHELAAAKWVASGRPL